MFTNTSKELGLGTLDQFFKGGRGTGNFSTVSGFNSKHLHSTCSLASNKDRYKKLHKWLQFLCLPLLVNERTPNDVQCEYFFQGTEHVTLSLSISFSLLQLESDNEYSINTLY
jgi:hypothetical protein